MTDEEAHESRQPVVSTDMPAPPVKAKAAKRLMQDLTALWAMMASDCPPEVVVRARTIIALLYGFADASGSGFGSTIIGPDGMRYRIGTWGPETGTESLNYSEFENVVASLELEAKRET